LDTLQTQFGCDSIITLNIRQNKASKFIAQKTICENENVTINGKKFNKNGIYNFKFKNQFGCDSTYTLDLKVIDTSIVFQEFLLCEGDSIQVGNVYYAKFGNYTNLLQSITGCDSTLNIKIKPAGEEYCEDKYCRMYIPNVFTPNGDNQNDFFEVKTNVATLTQLEIYDRWGNLQYQENSNNPKWDGTSDRGGTVEVGVYLYVVKGICGNGKPFMKSGDVTLVR
jgi:gliding motility-associated-like protein